MVPDCAEGADACRWCLLADAGGPLRSPSAALQCVLPNRLNAACRHRAEQPLGADVMNSLLDLDLHSIASLGLIVPWAKEGHLLRARSIGRGSHQRLFVTHVVDIAICRVDMSTPAGGMFC